MSSNTQTPTLLTRLNQDWIGSQAAREHLFGSLGAATAGEMLERVRRTRDEEQDLILYELITLARHDDRIAERVLIQVLIPAAAKMAHRVTGLKDLDRADRVGYAITAAWESIHAFPLRLHRRVHANLTMGMLHFLAPEKSSNDRLIADQTFAVSDEVLELHAGGYEVGEAPVEVQLAQVFTWALDAGVLNRSEISLISRVSLGDETQQEIADTIGVTRACLQKRVERSMKRLSELAREQFA